MFNWYPRVDKKIIFRKIQVNFGFQNLLWKPKMSNFLGSSIKKSLKCKNLLNFNCTTEKCHNCHHTNQHAWLNLAVLMWFDPYLDDNVSALMRLKWLPVVDGCGGLRRTRFGLIDGGSTTLFTEKTAFNFSQSLKSLDVIYTLRHSSS